ncbi:siderophore-interacting protein [Streptomyces sp. So13.3]|uniref:siderophore-interacting protein n=1 Tax=Streptomyces TaxID=1883 RepID=UPI0011074D3C|nr:MULTISPECIES: siderophore-interacting protein [Streptomyces]MCZ4102691.1 siderophore-interacting protein [Streptomyces sp. H39-C1]QNA71442.1 siderophore-interacting protein [Streptomyces sp. So13.3]
MSELPFRFFALRVLRTARRAPDFVRVTFGGTDLALLASGGRDQRFKLFLPQRGQDAPVMPDPSDPDWFTAWRALDPEVRGLMRTYTVAELRDAGEPDGRPAELDVDFALHGDIGPASRWAQAARPGDRVTILGAVEEDNGGIDFRPPPGTDAVLLTADATALPAVAGILAWLPPDLPAKVWIEIPHADDRRELPSRADTVVTWLIGDAAPPVLEAVRAAELPGSTRYAWIAGESGTVKALRRHLVSERGFDRRAITFTGYWKRGSSEDELLAEVVA